MIELIKNVSIKKVSLFYYLACHRNEWAWSKNKKIFNENSKLKSLLKSEQQIRVPLTASSFS